MRERGLRPGRGRQRPDSPPVRAAIRVLNRRDRVGETVRHAWNRLAVGAADWLRAQVPPEWGDRDGTRLENARLPNTAAARAALAVSIGADGRRLLQAVDAATDVPWLRAIPAVQTLRPVWGEPYTDPPGPWRGRAVNERAASAAWLAAPYAPAARYSTTREVPWVGATVHLTATCDAGQPPRLTQVMTTPATTPAGVRGLTIPHDLAPRDRLPSAHRLASGSVAAELLVTAQTAPPLDVVGPTLGSASRHRRAGHGDDFSAWVLDWEANPAHCPHGQTRVQGPPGRDVSGAPVGRRRFDRATCRACPARQAGTWAKNAPRQRPVRPHAQPEAIHAARQRQETAAFTAQEARRAGIEGPHAQGLRRCGLRQSRDLGLGQVHLQPLATAVALTIVR